MNAPFDPYHKWLGVAPKDQPPNHYRLLGIDEFEADMDVISLAADQRMAHVRTFQTGQNAALSQKLLNEIAAARICLLSPQKKATYDRALRPKTTARPQAAKRGLEKTAGFAAPALNGLDTLADEIGTKLGIHQTRRKRSQSKKPSPMPAIGAVVGITAVGVAALVMWQSRSGGQRPSQSIVTATSAAHPTQTEGSAHRTSVPDNIGQSTDRSKLPSAAASEPLLTSNPQSYLPDQGNVEPPDVAEETHATSPPDVAKIDSPPTPDVAYWPLDEGQGTVSRDLARGNHPLSLHNVQWIDGHLGGALQFDGSKAFAEADSQLSELQVPCTISLWVRPDARQGAHADVFGNHGDAFVGIHFHHWKEVQGQYAAGYGDGRKWYGAGNLPLQPDTWQHVAVVAGSTEMILYRNGVVGARGATAGRLVPNSGLKFMLARGYSKGRYFAGAIDDVRIYGRALFAAEIQSLAKMMPEADLPPDRAPAESMPVATSPAAAARLALLEPAMAYPATPPNRQPVPNAGAREQARKAIADLLKVDFKIAKAVEAKNALADRLKAMALETKADTAAQFVLFEEAAGLSLNAGITCQSIDELTKRFDVDTFELKAPQLERMAKEAPSGEMAGIANGCSIMVRESMAVDRLDFTARFLAIAKICAVKTKDRKLGAQIAEQSKEVERLRKAWDQFRAAVPVLKEQPDDAAANLAVGRYFAISKGDWDRGLSFLALGTDKGMREIAEQELAARNTGDQLFQLANEWWELAAGEKLPARTALRQHAADLYRQSLPSLSGIEKLRAELRIAESDKAAAGAPDNIFRSVTRSIETGQTTQTDFVGTERGRSFEDIGTGGLLVGFDYTTGRFGAGYRFTSITSLQPIYLTANGLMRGTVCGERSGEVKTVLAKDGFAIGGVKVPSAGLVEGFALIFMRVRGPGLKSKDAYESSYCGGQEVPNMPVLGHGKPIVGIIGNWDEHVRRLALIEVK